MKLQNLRLFTILIILFILISCKNETSVRNNVTVQTPPVETEKFITFKYKPLKNTGKVYLTGNFNNWKTEDADFEMKREGDFFVIHLNVKKLRKGKNLYLFIADGEWMLDVNAEATEDRGIGGKVGVLVVR